MCLSAVAVICKGLLIVIYSTYAQITEFKENVNDSGGRNAGAGLILMHGDKSDGWPWL